MEIDDKLFAARVFDVVLQASTLASNWAYYLTDKEFNQHKHLHVKICAIWIAGLLDSIQAEERVFNKYLQHAKQKNFTGMQIWLERGAELILYVKEMLSMYTKEEQLYIQDRRDQMVHGWLEKKYKKEFNVKYFDGESIVIERVTHREYFDMIRPLYEQIDSGNDPMLDIVARFKTPAAYHYAIDKLLDPEYRRDAKAVIYNDVS